jgi:hypothetical protein
MKFSDWASAIQNIIAAGAIIIAGVWAFFRFVKGRTLKHKGELTVEGSLLRSADRRAIRVRVHMRNTGLTKTPIENAYVRVQAMRPTGWDEREWRRITTVKVFEDHDWIEPQEPIGDELLIPLTGGKPALAYRLDAVVLPPKKRLRKRIQWSAHSVIGDVLQPTSSEDERSIASMGREDEFDLRIGEQKEASQEEIAAYEREARADEGQKQQNPSEEEVRRYEEETRQRHPSEDEVTSLEEEAQGGGQQSDED